MVRPGFELFFRPGSNFGWVEPAWVTTPTRVETFWFEKSSNPGLMGSNDITSENRPMFIFEIRGNTVVIIMIFFQ